MRFLSPEGGDKEKLECFVDFCEDAIFEMQHAESLMKADDSGGGKKESSGPSLPSEDAPRYSPHLFLVALGAELLLYL